MSDALTQGDVAVMTSNARGLASLGMAGGYDEVLYELADAIDGLFEQYQSAVDLLAEWSQYTGLRQRIRESEDPTEYETGRNLLARTDALREASSPASTPVASKEATDA